MESTYREWDRQRTYRSGKGRGRERRGTKVALGPRERRRLAQLGICIVLFLVVFIGKGIFPEQMGSVGERLTGIISGDTDFRAAFSSLGRSISGGEPVLETLGGLWVDVFGSGTVTARTWEPTRAYRHALKLAATPTSVTGVLAMDLTHAEVRTDQGGEPTAQLPEGGGAGETPPPQESAAPESTAPPETEPAVIHMEYDGPALPAGATMDKYALGLSATMSPIEGAEGWWVSSSFGWREHPVDGGEKFHNGVDLAVNNGTGVRAFASGVVDYIGESDIYGLYTQIDHGGGVKSFYAHCGELLVQKGQRVEMGDVIARSGDTGNATGPHLHFELKKDGVLLDPMYYIG